MASLAKAFRSLCQASVAESRPEAHTECLAQAFDPAVLPPEDAMPSSFPEIYVDPPVAESVLDFRGIESEDVALSALARSSARPPALGAQPTAGWIALAVLAGACGDRAPRVSEAEAGGRRRVHAVPSWNRAASVAESRPGAGVEALTDRLLERVSCRADALVLRAVLVELGARALFARRSTATAHGRPRQASRRNWRGLIERWWSEWAPSTEATA